MSGWNDTSVRAALMSLCLAGLTALFTRPTVASSSSITDGNCEPERVVFIDAAEYTEWQERLVVATMLEIETLGLPVLRVNTHKMSVPSARFTISIRFETDHTLAASIVYRHCRNVVRSRIEVNAPMVESAGVALRITEAVRAKMIGLSLPPASRPIPPPSSASLDSSGPGLFAMGLGGSVLAGPGGIGPLFGVSIQLLLSPGRLLLGVDGGAQFVAHPVESGGQSSSFNLFGLRGMLMVAPVMTRHLRVYMGPVLGGVMVVTRGRDSGLAAVSQLDRDPVIAFGGGLRLRFFVTAHFAILAAGSSQWLWPKIRLYFGDRMVASFGHPMIGGQLGILFSF